MLDGSTSTCGANLRMRLMFDPLARGLGRYIASE
jgi:hypothetical protein